MVKRDLTLRADRKRRDVSARRAPGRGLRRVRPLPPRDRAERRVPRVRIDGARSRRPLAAARAGVRRTP